MDAAMLYLQKKARYHRAMNVFAFIPAVSGILFGVYFSLRPKDTSIFSGSEAVFLTLILLGISAMIFLMRYLQTGAIFRQSVPTEPSYDSSFSVSFQTQHAMKSQQNQLDELQSSVIAIQDQIAANSATNQREFSSDQQQEMVDAIKRRIENSATEELILNLKEQAASYFQQSDKIDLIDQSCLRVIERLDKEISTLGRRGNLNLLLGISTTMVGLAVLYLYVSMITVDEINPWMAWVNFIPRLSLVILIEVFAYFFLKLYKSTLYEIKYFQNELTNIELKYVALKTSLVNGDENTSSYVVKSFSKTERNFILEKGQSTVDIEQCKINNESSSSITKAVSEMIKSFKRN